MQSFPIYLYPNTLEVILDLDPTTRGVNNVMYQRELTIQKGIKNNIRIQFKNSDQKLLPVPASGMFVFNMFDATTQRLVLEKELTILDDTMYSNVSVDQTVTSNTLTFASTTGMEIGQSVSGFGIQPNTVITSISNNIVTMNNPTVYPVTSATNLTFGTMSLRGTGQLTLKESDTVDLSAGGYRFSVVYKDTSDNTYLPTYANTYYDVAGFVKVAQDVYPVLQPSQEIVAFLPVLNTDTQLYEYKSGNVYAYPEYNSNSALHTMALYMTNFKGLVLIQGTLSPQPDSYNKYFTITSKTYNGFDGVDYLNFNGIYSYVRVIYIPSKGPLDQDNTNTAYSGTFDKVLYRS
jgi:hypothetical protein